MPRLSRCFIRSAMICLLVGFTLGGLILAAKGGTVESQVWTWLPVHLALLLNGWLLQLSMGVAYWILPRIQVANRGRQGWAWLSFSLFQLGIALILFSGLSLWMPPVANLFAPALILQGFGVVAFVIHAWPRIRPAIVRSRSVAK